MKYEILWDQQRKISMNIKYKYEESVYFRINSWSIEYFYVVLLGNLILALLCNFTIFAKLIWLKMFNKKCNEILPKLYWAKLATNKNQRMLLFHVYGSESVEWFGFMMKKSTMKTFSLFSLCGQIACEIHLFFFLTAFNQIHHTFS